MRVLRNGVLLVAAVCGCAQPQANTGLAASTDTRSGVIHVGMDYGRAHAMLMEHGAKDFMLQVLLEVNPEHPGRDLHCYQLPAGPSIEIISESAETGRMVASMRVSTYNPKPNKSKEDPEQNKFFRSFRVIEEFDLDNPPELLLTPTSLPAASSASQQTGQP